MSRSPRPLGTNLDDPETRPWFLWDEGMSVGELRQALADEGHPRWLELAAKVMREARDDQVWLFLPLERVAARYPDLAPLVAVARSGTTCSQRGELNLDRLHLATPGRPA